MLEYYRIFTKKLKPLPPEPKLSDFYHPSKTQKNDELLFFAVGISSILSADHLWNGHKAIQGLYKIMSMSKKDIKSWSAKQALYQVHIPPPKEINNPDKT